MSTLVRRKQVASLTARGISCRRACVLLSVARSTLNYEPKRSQRDGELLALIQRLAREHPRYGYPRIWALLRRTGYQVNHKRVYRLWREYGLSLRRRKRRRRRGPQAERPPVATRANEVWAYDFVHDRCANGQKLKCLAVVDEYTRECVAIEVNQRIKAGRVIEVLQSLMAQRGAPRYLRSDNGPEFVAHAVQAWLEQSEIGPVHIDPGKPWQNGMAESFIGKLRDECLNLEWFHTLEEARIIIEQYRRHYNRERPHSSLGYLTPTEMANESAGGVVALRPKKVKSVDTVNKENLTLEMVR